MELIGSDPKNIFLAILVFLGGCMALESPRSMTIQEPTSVESHILYEDNSFLIELKDDNTVWSSVIIDSTMQKQQKVNEPIRKNLGKLIGDYKKQRAGLKTTFLVKGHPQVQYALFGKVIDALRDNEEFKYNLVTAEENAPTAVNPSTPGSLDLPEAKHSEDDRRSKYDSIETKLTLLLLNTHLIYGYEGKNIGAGKMYDYSSVHGIIFNGSKKYGNKFVVIIKPGKDASYKNTVDILDEMTINKIKRFEMIEMNEKEKRFIKKMNTKS